LKSKFINHKIAPTHNYGESAELAFLYTQLYPKQVAGFQGFINATQSKSQLNIEDSAPNKQSLLQEIDFPLRQFLWFIRPAPDFIAYEEFFHRWQIIYARRHHLKVNNLLPWNQLNQIANSLHHHIAQYVADCKKQVIEPTMFPKYAQQADAKNKRLPNPMSRHSSADFPLYTILLENSAKHPSNNKLNQAFDDLIALTLVHEAQQLKVSEGEKHPGFLDPYEFLRKSQYHAPGHALLSEARRAIRKWSDKLRYTSFEKNIAPGLLGNYQSFKDYCTNLQEILKPLPQDNLYIEPFLRYFAVNRQSRTKNGAGGAQSFKKKDGGTGGHYWVNFDDVLIEGDASGYSVDIGFSHPELTENQFVEAQDAGEDPFEDINDLAQAEIVFLEDVPESRLILNQHTSHAQQLMATMNQRIWWAQTEFTLEDIEMFMRFLESSNKPDASGTAADILKMMVLLGIDIDKALGAYLVPDIDNIRWIKGTTKPPFGLASHPNNLLLTQARVDPKNASYSTNLFIPIWSYPIQTLAYLHEANSTGLSNYEAHANRIAFRDESGLIAEIQQRFGKVNAPTALFPIYHHQKLRNECQELLKIFNTLFNAHVSRPQEKRTLSFQKIQNYYWAQLQRNQIDHALIDTLDWNTPLNQIPTLHYYTHHLHRPVTNEIQAAEQSTGLQYILSAQTGLFSTHQAPFLPPTKNLSLGATELIKVQIVKDGIAQLVKDVNTKLMNPGTKGYAKFIETINSYSLYVMLWFCMETSHRPHHIPYLNIDEIDHLHGIIKLKDKSSIGGDKYRLAWISPELHMQMVHYADMLQHLEKYLKKFNISFVNDKNLCVFLKAANPPEKNSTRLSLKHGLSIGLLDAKLFRNLIRNNFGKIAPNFYRKLMVHQFLEAKTHKKISREHIRHWLGHWTHGTSPTNEFKTTNHFSYIQEIEQPLRKIMKDLGFKVVQLKLPRLPSKSELDRIQKKINKTSKSSSIKKTTKASR